MGSEWKPDDWWLEKDRQAGLDAVDAALKKHNFSLDRILTSRDPGMDLVRHELKIEHSAEGWQSWMLPSYLIYRVTFFFLQVVQPGAVLPVHAHEVAQFRMVLSGSILYRGGELKSGDWIYTPPGAEYSLSASLDCTCVKILYAY